MKHITFAKHFAMAVTVGALAFMAVPAYVQAHDGEVHDSSQKSSIERADKTRIADKVGEKQAAAREKLAERRDGRVQKTAEQRLKVCEARKKSIENKINAYVKHGENKLKNFDAIYERVKNFKTDKKLDVPNYDALLAAADAKQIAAAEAVAALKELTADFDCATSDPAMTIAAIKEATADTRTALKEYRTSIKNIVVALAQVNKTDETNSNDTTTTTPETTTETNQ